MGNPNCGKTSLFNIAGKHDELMSQNGAYRHLYESQMALENYGKGGVA